jgi:2,3-bisphosphoglycerate-dependent phosphoglycerate mutase
MSGPPNPAAKPGGSAGLGEQARGDVAAGGVRQLRFVRPPGATSILLVRHGESMPVRPGVPFPLVDGQGDPELAPAGREQAEQVAQRLSPEPITAIYVTTLRRTVETAAPLASRLGIVPMVEPGLREVHLGEWEGGLFRIRVAEGHPIAKRFVAEQRWDVIPGAETSEAFAARVRDSLAAVAARHPDQLVVVFTHGGVIGQALAGAAASSPFAFSGADNGSISHLVIASERWLIRTFNDAAHLHFGFALAAEPLT